MVKVIAIPGQEPDLPISRLFPQIAVQRQINGSAHLCAQVVPEALLFVAKDLVDALIHIGAAHILDLSHIRVCFHQEGLHAKGGRKIHIISLLIADMQDLLAGNILPASNFREQFFIELSLMLVSRAVNIVEAFEAIALQISPQSIRQQVHVTGGYHTFAGFLGVAENFQHFPVGNQRVALDLDLKILDFLPVHRDLGTLGKHPIDLIHICVGIAVSGVCSAAGFILGVHTHFPEAVDTEVLAHQIKNDLGSIGFSVKQGIKNVKGNQPGRIDQAFQLCLFLFVHDYRFTLHS